MRKLNFEKRAFGLMRDYFFIGNNPFVISFSELIKCKFFKRADGNTKVIKPKITIGI
jgi:hypothetical protein